ncbi:hypothetical protein [Faecalicoccus pleomorphus]|uniref:hypothetical protein n=1 Tax=Faecalicoccus pleomorphus TaxID=1323 RepID=UPI0039F5D846
MLLALSNNQHYDFCNFELKNDIESMKTSIRTFFEELLGPRYLSEQENREVYMAVAIFSVLCLI